LIFGLDVDQLEENGSLTWFS